MPNKSQSDQKRLIMTDICLVAEDNLAPLTSRNQAGIKSLGRKGATLMLTSPYLDGCHILMDVHNITPKLVKLCFPGEGGEPELEDVLWGKVTGMNYLAGTQGPRFLVELAWEERPGHPDYRPGTLKRVMQYLKKRPTPAGDVQ